MTTTTMTTSDIATTGTKSLEILNSNDAAGRAGSVSPVVERVRSAAGGRLF